MIFKIGNIKKLLILFLYPFIHAKQNSFVLFKRTVSQKMKMSPIWEFYEKVSKESAKCNKCGELKATKDSSTKGLITHLKRHPVEEHAYLELKKLWIDDSTEPFRESVGSSLQGCKLEVSEMFS